MSHPMIESGPCPKCPRLRGMVPSTGPSPARILLIGEAPHKTEDRMRIPFSGPTGRELDFQYLPMTGLRRSEVAICNAMACSLHLYRNPTHEEAKACADHHIPTLLAHYDPEIIIPMGSVACSLFHTRRGPIDLESQHGIPTVAACYGWVGPILPLYHPSAGIHDAFMRIYLLKDFPIIKQVMAGLTSHPKQVPGPPPDYALIQTPLVLANELLAIEQLGNGYVAIDTETDCQGFDLDPLNDPPFCLSFSGRPNTGYVITADNQPLLRQFQSWLHRTRTQVVMHNALFDVPVLARMGVEISWSRIIDTMLGAYHTGWIQQGLKQLAYRELGMEMQDFEDTVKPHALRPQLKYLMRVAEEGKKVPQPYLKPRQHKLYRKAKDLVDRVLEKDGDPQKKIRDNWWKKEPRDVEVMEEVFGKFPYCSIRMAPLEETVQYAGRDADATYRLRGVLVRERGNVRREASA